MHSWFQSPSMSSDFTLRALTSLLWQHPGYLLIRLRICPLCPFPYRTTLIFTRKISSDATKADWRWPLIQKLYLPGICFLLFPFCSIIICSAKPHRQHSCFMSLSWHPDFFFHILYLRRLNHPFYYQHKTWNVVGRVSPIIFTPVRKDKRQSRLHRNLNWEPHTDNTL